MNTRTAYRLIASMLIISAVLRLSSMTSPVSALESSNVKIVFSPSYVVNQGNTASTTVGIDFTNKGTIPTVLTTYDLQVGATTPENVSARHAGESFSTILIGDEQKAVRINLGEELLRVDETFHIDVAYDIPQFMTEVGQARDIEVPLTGGLSDLSVSDVSFTFPGSFGGVNYASASYTTQSKDGTETLTFEDVAKAERLFISIGDRKAYSLFIERTFENESDVYEKYFISLPPDTDSQQLVLTTISPYPSDVERSVDGNYTLIYEVGPGDTLWVRVQGLILRSYDLVSSDVMPSVQVSHYLDTSSDLWRITDEELLSNLVPIAEESVEDKVAWIYDFTIEELVLNEGFRSLHEDEMRKGAQVALKTYKGASVEDFADVFVALARQVDIPSRVVAGYVFPYAVGEKYLPMFHVWPQYWTEETGWISVDPAYEAYTDVGLSRGVGLGRVYMSLSYDSADFELYSDTTDEVSYTNAEVEPRVEIETEVRGLSDIVAGSGGTGILVVTNKGNCIMHSMSVSAEETSDMEVTLDDNSLRTAILPGETVEIPFTVEPPEWFVKGGKQLSFILVTASSSGTIREAIDQVVVVKPLWWVEPLSWLLTLIAFLITAGIVWLGYRAVMWYKGRNETPNLDKGMLE